jgi:hypothetical protein
MYAAQGGMGTAPAYTQAGGIVVEGVMLVREGYTGIGLARTRFEVRAILLEDYITFVGGKDGAHSIHHHSTAARILAHWEGYCENNGLALRAGTIVQFAASNLWRKAPVLVAPGRTSTTVQVGGFRYKHQGMARPRRVSKLKLRIVRQPRTE